MPRKHLGGFWEVSGRCLEASGRDLGGEAAGRLEAAGASGGIGGWLPKPLGGMGGQRGFAERVSHAHCQINVIIHTQVSSVAT